MGQPRLPAVSCLDRIKPRVTVEGGVRAALPFFGGALFRGTHRAGSHPIVSLTAHQKGERQMLRLHSWAYRFGLLAALILAAGAGKKWGG
jgi:hypothetical protein